MAFDQNKDGKLTRAEVPERFQGLFDRTDPNKDGEITEAELKQAAAAQAPIPGTGGEGRGGRGGRGGFEGRGRGGPAFGADALVSGLDANRDGVLSTAELDAATRVLRRFDADGDGLVTMEEALGAARGGGRR